eukprot:jgi/Chlat1/1193/Chrsp115S01657
MVRRVAVRRALSKKTAHIYKAWKRAAKAINTLIPAKRRRRRRRRKSRKDLHLGQVTNFGDHRLPSRRTALFLAGMRTEQLTSVYAIKCLEEQSELKHLHLAARRYLLDYEGRGGECGDAVLWVNLPAIHWDKVDVVRSINLSPQAAAASRGNSNSKLLRANPDFYGYDHFDDVAVSGGTDSHVVEWVAQLRFLFLMKDVQQTEHACTLIRWYNEYGPQVPLLGQRRYTWAEGAGQPWFDVVGLENIQRMVHMVLDYSDTSKELWFVNNFRH